LSPLEIIYNSPATSGTLKFTPRPGAVGLASITVTVQEPGTYAISRTFTVALRGKPVFTAGPVVTVDVDSGRYRQYWATGIAGSLGNSAYQALWFSAGNDAPALSASSLTLIGPAC